MGSMHKELEALESILEGSAEPTNIPLSVLRHITDDFSDDRKIGQGGFGVVYKGILTNKIIAVKKLSNALALGEKQFRQEVRSMMKVKHENIVRFIGYCSNTEEKAMDFEGQFILAERRERLLCFEYISNGSLENNITDELRGHEWHTRFEIIKGICEGLHHLHKEVRIIHMDLKPANILLDDDMVPKIADFGLSRLDEASQTLSTERFLTLGYCAPEYLLHGRMSILSDIYSLGVIIIELVTGSKECPNITNVLRRWRHRWNKSAKHNPLVYQQVTTCIELALRCQEEEPTRRPFIWDIVGALNQIETTNSNESTIDQEISCLEDMLGIEPLELHFPFELRKMISCSVQLTNDTNYYFAFSVKTTNPLQFYIQPDKGVISPRSKCSVAVILQSQEKVPNHRRWTYEFSVLSYRMDEVLTGVDITEHLFNRKMGKEVDKVDLTVVLDVQQLLEEPREELPVVPLVHDNPNYQEAANTSGEAQLNPRKESVRKSSEIIPVMSRPLDIHPLQLHFLLEPRRHVPCSLYLTNQTDEHVVFKLEEMSSNVSGTYGTFGVVLPRSTCTLVVTTKMLKHPTLWRGGHLIVQYVAHKDKPSSKDEHELEEIFTKAKQAGNVVHEETVEIFCLTLTRELFRPRPGFSFGGDLFSGPED